jgi:adenosylhomocysteinase
MDYDIYDINLADEGLARIQWAFREMPVLGQLMERFKENQSLQNIRVGGCLHITTETANLAIALQTAGAEVRLCASNPLSTQDDVAAALVQHYGIPVFAIRGEDNDTYYRHINSVLDSRPQITLDDGGDLVSEIHRNRADLLEQVIGGCEETTTGVIRLRAMANEGALKYPMIAVKRVRRNNPRHQYTTGWQSVYGSGLRLVRTRYRYACQRTGRKRSGNGSGPIACTGSRNGRLSRHAVVRCGRNIGFHSHRHWR